MKKLLKFENFVKESYELKESLSKEELVEDLSEMQDVYSSEELKSMTIDQLNNLYQDVLNAKDEESSSKEPTNELEYESKKWIQDAIKRPGALRRKMKKKEGEKITKSEIDSELQALKSKDKDPEKPGLQLSKRDRTKQKQLVLAKTLKGIKD